MNVNDELGQLDCWRDKKCVDCGRTPAQSRINIEGMIHHGGEFRCIDRKCCESLKWRNAFKSVEVKSNRFETLYSCIPEKELMRDRQLRKLGERYRNITEEYDKMICSGPIIRGSIIPRGPEEREMATRHARMLLREFTVDAEMLGFTREDLMASIQKACVDYKSNQKL